MYDNAKHKVGTESFRHLADVFELRYAKRFSQGTGYTRIFLFWNHATLSKDSKRLSPP